MKDNYNSNSTKLDTFKLKNLFNNTRITTNNENNHNNNNTNKNFNNINQLSLVLI